MPTAEVARTTRGAVLEQLLGGRYAYPSAEFPDREATANFPTRQMGVQVKSGGWLYPDIVVTDEPGHFVALAAEVALAHEVTSEVALERWAPLSKAAPLVLYVPLGQAGRAQRLLRLHKIQVHKLVVWRLRPAAFGIDLQDAYSGPDLFAPIARLLPAALKPMSYRPERNAVLQAYLQPLPGARIGDVPNEALPEPDAPAVLALPSGEAEADHGEAAHEDHSAHLPPPSLAPLLFAAGLIVTGLGAVFPGEMLGVGIALIAVSALRWFIEDMGYYEAGGPAEYRQRPLGVMPGPAPVPPGVHMPPPSMSPVIFALGLILTGLGAVFPAELLGAGITLIAYGGISWFFEDIKAFEQPEEHHGEEHGEAPPLAAGEEGAG